MKLYSAAVSCIIFGTNTELEKKNQSPITFMKGVKEIFYFYSVSFAGVSQACCWGWHS
jgi:hypothetical protein